MEVKAELEIKRGANEETEKTLPVSRIHFLIHPGFTTDPKVFPKNRNTLQRNEKLLEKYLESAKTMTESEIMMAFIHSTPRRFLEDLKKGKAYARTVQMLKAILGQRLIVISDKFDIFSTPEAITKALQIAEGRGFRFDQNVESVAYGESYGLCVPDAADNFNKVANLTQKTTILLPLTSAIFDDPAISKNILDNQMADKERIEFEAVEIPM